MGMKKTFIIFIVLVLVMTVFMSGALAAKPEDKPNNGDEQGEDEQGEEPDGEEGPKKPNEKRDAKKLFKEETRPLIDEVHANREEWGMLGEDQDGVGELIDAQIEALTADEFGLDPAVLALVKEKIAQLKVLKAEMRSAKRDVHSLWKDYIGAKKISDVDAGVAALTAMIAVQETRIGMRVAIAGVIDEIAAALGIVTDPPEPVVPEA